MKGKKTGGRVKGTPNKATATVKDAFTHVLSRYQNADTEGDPSLMFQDFISLDPKDRIYVALKMSEFVAPKMQAVSISNEDEKPITIDQRLVDLSKAQQR